MCDDMITLRSPPRSCCNSQLLFKTIGCDEAVTSKNLHEWVGLYSAWKMVDSVQEQLRAFLKGFYEVVSYTRYTLQTWHNMCSFPNNIYISSCIGTCAGDFVVQRV